MSDNVWMWNSKLSWELFSSAVYDYRKLISETKAHRQHALCKSGLFASVTSVEAYLNEVLMQEEKWSQNKLRNKSIEKKLETFEIELPEDEKKAKQIRNDFLVHHKRIDQRYFLEINPEIFLDSIEIAQEIIARICFKRGVVLPYWITGINFVNPLHNFDICLLSDYDFWRHVRDAELFDCIDGIVDWAGKIYPPFNWEDYRRLYDDLWKMLKNNNFELDKLSMKIDRFPHMPYLKADFWE